MTTAVIGTGGIGSVIARQLASGGETLRLSSADRKSARTLAAGIGRAAVVAVDNRDALRGADAVVFATVRLAGGRGWAEPWISDGRLQAAWACWVVSSEYRCWGVW
jgi:ornithine cyclodeaminase/alanine dehydrogenase-like protein (mu-crystallin family)